MRIAFFLEIFYPQINGVITSTLDLARNLRTRGHHVLLVVPGTIGEPQVRDVDGIEVFPLPSFSTPIYPGVRFSNPWSRKLLRKLREENIEIIHITGPWTIAWSAINHARRLNLPVIHTFHTMLNEDSYILYFVKLKKLVPLGRKIIWWYLGKYILASDVITAPSGFACDELRRRYPEKKIHHISNGTDRSQFPAHVPYEDLTAAYPFFNKKTFLFVGRIGQEKSLDILIRAVAWAAAQDSSLRLAVAGDGPSRPEIERLAAELGVEEKVAFLGKIPHQDLLKSGLLHHSRALVTASVTENQPMTIIEAVCCGLPIVVADVASMRELSQGNALLFSPGDSADLGKKLLELAEDDELCTRLHEAAKELAERFDGVRVAESFEKIYREAAKPI